MVGNSQIDTEAQEALSQSNLQQGSISLPPPRSGKTADEVWKEIQGKKRQQAQDEEEQKQKQAAAVQGGLGEMTLEDFLVKAGIVKDCTDVGPAMATFGSAFAVEGPAPHANLESIVSQNQQQLDWYNYQLKQQQLQGFFLQQQAEAAAAMAGASQGLGPVGGILMPGNALEAPFDIGPGLAPGNLASGFSLSPGIGPDIAMADAASKRRGFDVIERTVERRQRRMIKNRESAARSRARKQAYTMELETELMQLKEENVRLKRMKLVQTAASLEESKRPAERILRRTRSASC